MATAAILSFLFQVLSKTTTYISIYKYLIYGYKEKAMTVRPWPCSQTIFIFAYVLAVYLHSKWKALKCQTLGAAVHVIGLVCWLEIDHCLVTLSYLPSVFCFVSACVKFAHEFLTLFERLVQLIFSFPIWFHTIWFYCSHAFQSFLSQSTLCFWSKDSIAFTGLPSYRSFTLRAYLCWGHTYSLTANDE